LSEEKPTAGRSSPRHKDRSLACTRIYVPRVTQTFLLGFAFRAYAHASSPGMGLGASDVASQNSPQRLIIPHLVGEFDWDWDGGVQEVCKRFQRGRCTFGHTCKFAHPSCLLEQYQARALPDAFADQCKWLIHGQRRCKNSAVITSDGLCSIHSKMRWRGITKTIKHKQRLNTAVALNTVNTAASLNTAAASLNTASLKPNSHKPHRISSSHKRMMNPMSSMTYPAPICTSHPQFCTLAPTTTNNNNNNTILFPLVVDIGCARGRWVLELAQGYPRVHVLGLELRSDLIEEATAGAPDNAAFRCMNCKNEGHWKALLSTGGAVAPASASAPSASSGMGASASMGASAPVSASASAPASASASASASAPLPSDSSSIACARFVAIQFPDPWSKARHRRRRLVDAHFVALVRKYLFHDNLRDKDDEERVTVDDIGDGDICAGVGALKEKKYGNEDDDYDATSRHGDSGDDNSIVDLPPLPPRMFNQDTSRPEFFLGEVDEPTTMAATAAEQEDTYHPNSITPSYATRSPPFRTLYVSTDRADLFAQLCSVLCNELGISKRHGLADEGGKTTNSQHLSHHHGLGKDVVKSTAPRHIPRHEEGGKTTEIHTKHHIHTKHDGESDRNPLMGDFTATDPYYLNRVKDVDPNPSAPSRVITSPQAFSAHAHPLHMGTERDRVCEHLHRKVHRAVFLLPAKIHGERM